MTGTSRLAAEIREQPDALRRLLAAEGDPAGEIAAGWRARGDVVGMMLAARGTSDNAARYAQYVFGAFNRMVVSLAAPSLFSRYRRPPRLEGLVVGAISQSGRSPDVVGVVAEARRQGRPTFAVTNDVGSPLAAAADAVVGLQAGEERSVAASKTYTTSLGAVALLSAAHARDAARAEQLAGIPGSMAAVIDGARGGSLPAWLADAPACAVVGRGFNYATAFEIALKLKELTGVAAEAYSSADFLHGPVAAVRRGIPVVLVAPSGAVFADVAELAAVARGHGARVVAITDDDALLDAADLAFALPATPEWLSPLVAAVPGQMLALRLAVARGLDVDRPAGLRKITETR